jgi:hypothetical protein
MKIIVISTVLTEWVDRYETKVNLFIDPVARSDNILYVVICREPSDCSATHGELSALLQ